MSKKIIKLEDRINDLAESLFYANENGRFEGWKIAENEVSIRHNFKKDVPEYIKKPWRSLASQILKRW